MEPRAPRIVLENRVRAQISHDLGRRFFVFVLRGLPGSGKSSLCEDIQQFCRSLGLSFDQCSADRWFERGGVYDWNDAELHEAHEYCQAKFLFKVRNRTNVIVVDNTNLRRQDYSYYLDVARETRQYETIIIELDVLSEQGAEDAFYRSRHFNGDRDIRRYNPRRRWRNFEHDNQAMVFQAPGLTRDHRRNEYRRRGYE